MKKTINLRWKIMSYLLMFVAAVLTLIYLFQIVFLQRFYINSKVDEIMKINNSISYNFNSVREEEFTDFLKRQVIDYNVCIRILYQDDHGAKDFIIDNLKGYDLSKKTTSQLLDMTNTTAKNGGSYLFKEGVKADFDLKKFDLNSKSAYETGTVSYTYSKIYETNDYFANVLVSTYVAPVNATIETLKDQYWVFVVIVVLSAILLALILSKRIVKPIQLISDEAFKLSSGEYKEPDGIKNSYYEVKQLNETLNDANSRIKAADKAKRDLIANVSHDLRTPLTMIGGYGEMMRDLPGENNAENAQVIIDESKRLSLLVNDLIDLSHLQDRNLKLNIQDISVHKILNDLYKQYKGYATNQGFEFNLELDKDCIIACDEKRIKQVLYNFINNAFNYSNDDKYILIRQTIVDDSCLIEVIDHGSGIDEKRIADIWDRYYKIDSVHKRFSSGSGIGLAIAKEVLMAHGFEFGVKSKVDEGSNFYFTINSKK